MMDYAQYQPPRTGNIPTRRTCKVATKARNRIQDLPGLPSRRHRTSHRRCINTLIKPHPYFPLKATDTSHHLPLNPITPSIKVLTIHHSTTSPLQTCISRTACPPHKLRQWLQQQLPVRATRMASHRHPCRTASPEIRREWQAYR